MIWYRLWAEQNKHVAAPYSLDMAKHLNIFAFDFFPSVYCIIVFHV